MPTPWQSEILTFHSYITKRVLWYRRSGNSSDYYRFGLLLRAKNWLGMGTRNFCAETTFMNINTDLNLWSLMYTLMIHPIEELGDVVVHYSEVQVIERERLHRRLSWDMLASVGPEQDHPCS